MLQKREYETVGADYAVAAFAGAQQEKMKGCNVEAKKDGLKGDDLKVFMSNCLKGVRVVIV